MNKTKILIAEDDVLISEELSDILIGLGYDVVGIAEDYEAAVNILEVTPPDIAILDINMQGREQGFEIATYLNEIASVPFLFLSSYTDTKTLDKAATHNPLSYITKPFSKTQISSSLKVAIASQKANQQIVVKDGGKKTSVNIKDILYLKADGIYTELHTTNKKMLLRTSIKSFEQEYPLIKLVRIHRSFAVNIKAIVSISTSEIQLPNTSLPISRSYKEEVHTVYNELPYL